LSNRKPPPSSQRGWSRHKVRPFGIWRKPDAGNRHAQASRVLADKGPQTTTRLPSPCASKSCVVFHLRGAAAGANKRCSGIAWAKMPR
jgi:hypothetical protein